MYTGKYLSLERSGIIGKSRDYNDYCCLWLIDFIIKLETATFRDGSIMMPKMNVIITVLQQAATF